MLVSEFLLHKPRTEAMFSFAQKVQTCTKMAGICIFVLSEIACPLYPASSRLSLYHNRDCEEQRSGDSSVVRAPDSRVRIPAGAAGEFPSPVSTSCADSYFGICSTPVLPQ